MVAVMALRAYVNFLKQRQEKARLSLQVLQRDGRRGAVRAIKAGQPSEQLTPATVALINQNAADLEEEMAPARQVEQALGREISIATSLMTQFEALLP